MSLEMWSFQVLAPSFCVFLQIIESHTPSHSLLMCILRELD